MAYNALNNLIDAYIYANGVQAITGQILNGVLKQMVSQLGSGYHLMGVATPQTVPATDDYAMAYFAATAGEYTDFGGITLAAGEVAVLLTSGNGSWSKQTIYNVPTGTDDLENTAGFITNTVADLVNYYTKTEVDDTLANYPTLEALATALADYYTKNDIDGLLSVVNAALADRYTKSETDTKLADYYKKTETYDKDEVDSIVATLSRQEYIVAWDGLAAPDVTAIPSGVTVTYSGTTYTGTLAASASTVNKIYMVWNGTAYDMYGTSQDGGYSWVPMGTTTVDLSQYATKAEVSQLEAEVDGETGITIHETRSGLNYQEVHIPQGGNYKIKLLSGYRVYIYTKETSDGAYTQQGLIAAPGDSITLDTTTAINYLAIYPLTSTLDNTCMIYIPGGICERVLDLGSSVSSLSGSVSTLNGQVSTINGKVTKLEEGVGNLNGDIAIPFSLTDDGFIAYSNGNVIAAVTYKYTDYIYCKNWKSVRFLLAYADAAGVAFYDDNKEYISGVSKSADESFGDIVNKNIPDGACYFRISVHTDGVSDFVLYSTDYRISEYVKKEEDAQLAYPLGTLQNGFIGYSDGVFYDAATYRSTGFIKLLGNRVKYKIYFKDAAGVAFYDEDKNYISGYGNPSGESVYGTFAENDIPSGAVYVRYCGHADYENALYIQCANNVTLVELLNDFTPTVEQVNPCFYKDSSGCRTFKKILCIGDSLTQGTFEYRDGSETLTYFVDESLSFPTFLKCLTGRDTTNKGHGGLSTKTWWEAHQNDDLSGHDACIIALGRNDYAVGRETTSAERYEYMGDIISKVRTENPQIKVFVATMLNYYTGVDADAVNEDMRGIAETNNCYLLDISAYGELTVANDAYSHLTAEGYEKVANYYFNYISYIMAQNPTDFKNIQFTGTAHYY